MHIISKTAHLLFILNFILFFKFQSVPSSVYQVNFFFPNSSHLQHVQLKYDLITENL